jgi:TM2 domain-containing membrane protein YozV
MIIRSCLTCTFLCAIFLTEAQTGTQPRSAGTQVDSSKPSGVPAQPQPALSGYADSLYRQGRYFDASIACERILFGGGDAGELFHAVIRKTQCLKKQLLYDQTVTFLNAWQSYPFPDSAKALIHYEQVLCTFLGGRFENVVSLVDRWPYLHAGQPPAPLLKILKILSLNELQRWNEAGEAYRKFIVSGQLPAPPPDLYAQLPRLKSVTKAQWLSTFIPGAGQFYAGRPGEAMLSIAIQAAGIWFAVVSLQQHYYVSAWLIGAALFGSFHMGGVRRSEVLVRQYNRKKILAFNEKVKEQLLQLAP